MSNPGFRKQLVSNELNTNEILGSIVISKTSSILAFASFGANSDTVYEIMKWVDGVAATMWSLVPLTIRAASGNKEAEETCHLMVQQIEEQLNGFMSILKDIEEQTVESVKQENNKH